jgi:hypothetical protein
MLYTDDDLLLLLQDQFRQYAKGSKEDDYTRTAHNVRNRHSNPRNNLRRRIGRVHGQPLIFDAAEVDSMVRLTDDQRAALDHWNGTDRELPFR